MSEMNAQKFREEDVVVFCIRQKLDSKAEMSSSTREYLEYLAIDLDGSQHVIDGVSRCSLEERVENPSCDGYRYYLKNFSDYVLSDEIMLVNSITEDFEDIETLL